MDLPFPLQCGCRLPHLVLLLYLLPFQGWCTKPIGLVDSSHIVDAHCKSGSQIGCFFHLCIHSFTYSFIQGRMTTYDTVKSYRIWEHLPRCHSWHFFHLTPLLLWGRWLTWSCGLVQSLRAGRCPGGQLVFLLLQGAHWEVVERGEEVGRRQVKCVTRQELLLVSSLLLSLCTPHCSGHLAYQRTISLCRKLRLSNFTKASQQISDRVKIWTQVCLSLKVCIFPPHYIISEGSNNFPLWFSLAL